ncbi:MULTISPECIES: PilZ domain-containing protein [Paenibacillus]|uniref:PilZ domain-containing protein n=1 Tax=Paenibacillus TaxID=44249 RepID=UPI0022B93F35|nr:PilZ domain-containing protein [Paenibacillus caseinilyticus]MCZ8523379.1 PilZ domain-containing protein [Paenibacillus caseinilyticus]
MMKTAAARLTYDLTEETYRSPSGIMLNSRTVVEKANFVSTGILSYAEGDILEIEMSDYKVFELGDTVKLTVYSPGGIYMFESTVVAKDHGALMIINPPQNRDRFAEKRENPRIAVKEEGCVMSIRMADGSDRLFEEQVELKVHNISVSGVGFTLPEDVGLSKYSILQMQLDLGFEMPCRAEIARTERTENGEYYYGAQFIDMAKDKANSLRAFVLKKQVESHFLTKREEMAKRIFK